MGIVTVENNRKSYVIYHILLLLVNLSDLESYISY